MKFFWINLDISETRRNNMIKQFNEENIDNYRVEAYHPLIDTSTRNCNGAENACLRSHIQAIFHFLMNTNDKYAIICEDDLSFEFKPYWNNTLEEVLEKAPRDWGIIQLAVILQSVEHKFKNKDLYIKYSEQPASSTLAYAIHRKCAMQLLHKYIDGAFYKKYPTADCFRGGIYARVNSNTEYTSYIYKFPMFTYPDNNDSLINNCLPLHIVSKRQVLNFLKKYSTKKPN